MTLSGRHYGDEEVVLAIRRHGAGSLLWDEAIQYVFVFSEKHKLTRVDVFSVYTSL